MAIKFKISRERLSSEQVVWRLYERVAAVGGGWFRRYDWRQIGPDFSSEPAAREALRSRADYPHVEATDYYDETGRIEPGCW